MTMLNSGVTVLAAGPKGLQFITGLASSGVRPGRVISYPQRDDPSNAFDLIVAACRDIGVPFETERKPHIGADEFALIVGWQFLLPPGAEQAIVFHDSLLPKYRGFAPTVTALINGDPQVGVSALRLADGADTGPLLGQRSLPVTYPVKIETVLRSQVDLMVSLAVELIQRVSEGTLDPVAQNEADATISLWRDEEDYWIDWQQPAVRICRFVDALGPPYAGARTQHEGGSIVLRDVTSVDIPPVEFLQPGKCWMLDKGRPVVICGVGAVRIDRAVAADGEIVSFSRLRSRFRSMTQHRASDAR